MSDDQPPGAVAGSRKELFIVEGKSAASTVRQAMHKPTQAVHAMQGKVLNVTRAKSDQVLKNLACNKLFERLACGTGDACIADNLAYSRVLLLTDPDIDGVHTRALLASLFTHYLHPLVRAGLVYAVVPPLFRLADDNASACQYFYTEQARAAHMALPTDTTRAQTLTRIRGVAQFSLDECARLLLCEESRNSLQLRLDPVINETSESA